MTGIIVAVTLCGNTMAAFPMNQQVSFGTGEFDVSSRCTAASLREEKGAEAITSFNELDAAITPLQEEAK